MVNILQKGENISLNKIIPTINEIIVSVKWLKKSEDQTEFDIDSSAFMLTEQNKTRSDADFIFYNQPKSIDNAIVFKNNMFKITLNNIPQDINKIHFVLTLHDAKSKQQHFGMLENITIELFDFVDKQKLISYCDSDANTETAIILGTVYRYNREWKFRAIGQGYVNGLDFLARNFGVNIDEPVEHQQNQITESNSHKEKKTENAKKETSKNTNSANTQNNSQKSKTQYSNNNSSTKQITPHIDIHNTDMMTKIDHYAPIVDWLKQRNFQAQVNEAAIDTSGFFDEIAVELGDNYELLKKISDTIKRSQQKKYDNASIYLSKYSQKDIEVIHKFCKQLYDYAFVAKYYHDKKADKIILRLQSATKIINFFNGEWLEWFAVMKIAALCHERNINFSCTRNMKICLPDDNDKYEIDVFFLIDNSPLFIECKSGEYREFIDKYSKLRRKLFIPKPYFLMLTLGVDDERVKGLTAMFDITFVNEKILFDYIINSFVEKNSANAQVNTFRFS